MVLRFFFGLIFCFSLQLATAQDAALAFTKLNRWAKERVVYSGEEIIVQKIGAISHADQISGALKVVGADRIMVGNVSIPLDSIDYVIIPFKHRLAMKLVGVPVILFGAAYSGISGLFLLVGAVYNDNVFVIGGAIDLVIGLGIITAGLYPYYTKGQKMKINRKWSVEAIGVAPTQDDYYRPPVKKE